MQGVGKHPSDASNTADCYDTECLQILPNVSQTGVKVAPSEIPGQPLVLPQHVPGAWEGGGCKTAQKPGWGQGCRPWHFTPRRYVQVCTAGVSLCTLFHNIILHPVRTPSGKCRSCSRSPRGVQEGTLRGAAPSEDTPGGCLSPSHGPSGPPTCSGRALAASRTLLLERKNTGGKRQWRPPPPDGGKLPPVPRAWLILLNTTADGRAPSHPLTPRRAQGALACIFSRQLAQKATSRLSRLTQKSVKSLSSRSANFSSPVALERQVLVSMVL